MVIRCCIQSCSEQYSSGTNVSFHQFPKNPELRKQWIQRTNVKLSAKARVCSKHFSNDCFIQHPWNLRRALKHDALPNILNTELSSEKNASNIKVETANTKPGTSSTKKRKAYVGDYRNLDIDDDKKNYQNIVNTTIAKKNRVIKTLLQKNRRLEQKIKDLNALVDELRNNEIITKDASILLSACNYVKQTFQNVLPHPRTLQRWYSSESVNTVKIKVSECEAKGRSCVCALMLGEMAIHKKIEWDAENLVVYVDIGTNDQSDTTIEAPVYLINCINDRWKLPVSYFLVNCLSGEQKSNLIKMCVQLLHNNGFTICSVSFDGAASNLAMAICLGTQLSSACLKPSIPHPATGEEIELFLDPPHMLKLIRNTLGTYNIFYDDNNSPVKWEHLVNLVNVQEEDGCISQPK